MSRLPIAKFIGSTVIIWVCATMFLTWVDNTADINLPFTQGIICMCLAAPTNFAGFAAVRCLLGFAEGAVTPAFITITSIWYKKEEHPLRVGMWVTVSVEHPDKRVARD